MNLTILESKILYLMSKLPLAFYKEEDPVLIAQKLIGKRLCTKINNQFTAGIITETEAYDESEKGCHAYKGKRTPRTEIMFHEGGFVYVYLCYGIHHLFNVVTGKNDHASAVLVRGILPEKGIKVIEKRRKQKLNKNLTNGPGKISQALGINTSHYGCNLVQNTIWIEEGKNVAAKQIIATPRIGIDYAEEDALLPWRFVLNG